MAEAGKNASKPRAVIVIQTAIGIGAALLIGGTVTLLAPRTAAAKPEFAAQTGLPCGQCHVSPAGGGKLKAFGEKFKANGFKVK